MKIIFICGSLEPGRDGVGDYTRMLSGALKKQGHVVSIVAMNDAHVESAIYESQTAHAVDIPVFRLPRSLDWPLKLKKALEWIQTQTPDWVSLQFVPFTFHPKGLCLRLGELLCGIKKIARLHVMFHEPWLLWNSPLPYKLRGLGAVQKLIIKWLLKRNPPDATSTSLPLFKRALQKIVKNVELLPLFSGIPVVPSLGNRAWLLDKCQNSNGGEVVLAGFFGQISPLLSKSILQDFIEVHIRQGKHMVIFHAGGIGVSGTRVWDELVSTGQADVQWVSLGRLSDQDASRYFQGLDFALTAYSEVTWGKSSVVAAMREHGLTVIPCGDDALPVEKKRAKNSLPSPWNVDMAAIALLRQLDEK